MDYMSFVLRALIFQPHRAKLKNGIMAYCYMVNGMVLLQNYQILCDLHHCTFVTFDQISGDVVRQELLKSNKTTHNVSIFHFPDIIIIVTFQVQ